MTVNCVNVEKEEEFLNITNINLLVRFNKTMRNISQCYLGLKHFPTSASAERVNSKERVTKVPCSIPAASYAQR